LGSISTTVGSLLDHATPLVICALELSLYVPQACKARLVDEPTSISGLGGWMAMELRVLGWKNPLQLIPAANAMSMAKASVNGSLRPANIANRLV
jgi:hypothetical protein